MKGFVLIFCCSILFVNCSDNSVSTTENITEWEVDLSLYDVPEGFPEIEYPEDNYPTKAKIELGKKLFFDPILSDDRTISCASCHFPEYAFSDTVALSKGVQQRTGKRNAPSLMNIAYHPILFRDGGAPTLEIQLITPIQDENEMNLNITEAIDRLSEDSTYTELFDNAFGQPPSLFGLSRAIAAYERTLISGDSKYDDFKRTGDSTLFNSQELLGLKLFSSDRLNCTACHNGFDFTDYSFRNNGLYTNYTDPGRANITLDSADLGKFKVPSLRNVALTSPYMHDGSLPDLKAVIHHYNSIEENNHLKDTDIQSINLAENEINALISFLNTLTDKSLQKHYNQ